VDAQLIADRTLLDAQQATGTIAVPDAVFRVEGPGTIACLQGLLTNDLQKIGPQGLVWGAFLTPKGMIVTDAWIARDGDAAWVIVPREARETVRELFKRGLPPRLARVTDRSDELAVRWVRGVVPPGGTVFVAAPTERAPFAALAIGPEADLDALGLPTLPIELATLCRVVDGWPTHGREIDEKTLPQEVRFDELHGVKYDKGCYTGQETVARLHFRGHANRTLRAVRLVGTGTPLDGTVQDAAGKEVAQVTTIAVLDGRWHGLAKIRREVETGAAVTVGGVDAEVLDFPLV
jgi:folate-binding protein YgfZ